jgi:uncharacterized protein (TIGR02996 family)
VRDDEALLRAVIDAPDDDAPRLVYADWLDERADAAAADRAEFIRTQIERHRLEQLEDPGPAERDRIRFLRNQEQRLLSRHREEWVDDLRRWFRYGAGFERGFVEAVACAAWVFARHGARLVRRVPLRHAVLDGMINRSAALANAPHLARIRQLTVESHHSSIVNDDVVHLAASPNLGELVELDLFGNRGVGLDGLRALAESTAFPNLRNLYLGQCERLSDPGAEIIVETGGFRRLERLTLGVTNLGDAGLRHLAASPCLTSLQRWNLSGNRFGVEGLDALANSEHFPALRWLELNDLKGVSDGGLALMAESPLAPRLEALHLRMSRISDAGLQAAARSDRFDRLRSLNLRDNAITDRGAEALARMDSLADLRELDLTANGIGDAGLAALTRSRALRGLRVLRVGDNRVTARGLKALIDSPAWPQLAKLEVGVESLTEPMSRALRARFPAASVS